MAVEAATITDPSEFRRSLVEEDVARANLYRLLASFLSRPPHIKDQEYAANLKGDASALGIAIANFAKQCRETDSIKAAGHYHDLFIGLVRGELLPYASYYLTGFLHEKPLAKLRMSLKDLGIEREPDVKEPEDHIAALLDVMAGLILGEFGEAPSIDTQREFFETHIGPWASYFFTDLEEQQTSELYAALGTIGRVFMEIEETAFQMG